MVARTNVSQRIDIQLHAIESAVSDLPEIVDEWDELPDGERASLSLDWDHLMGSYLIMLDQFREDGEMTVKQTRRYHTLLQRLSDSSPLIERLNFYRPPVSLD
jgi:hypothetical protein